MPYDVMIKEAYQLIDEIPHDKIEYVVQLLRSASGMLSDTVAKKKSKRTIGNDFFGALQKYANPSLIESESDAWEKAVAEKYGNANDN